MELERDPDIRLMLRRLGHAARWSLLPYGWWTERGGSYVIFDRCYRPICRVLPGGEVEIVASDTFISFVRQQWLYRSYTHPHADEASRAKVLGVIDRLGLRDEIIRRRALQKDKRLPRWERHTAKRAA